MVFSPLKNHELYVIIWVQQSYNRKPLPENKGGLQSTANHPFSRGFVWLLQTVGCKSSFVSQQWLWNIVAVRFSINRFFIMQKDLTNSQDLTIQEVEQLANIFPQFISEWKVDINWLSQYLQWEKVEWERYNLNRYGKSQAKLIAREPSKATLIPDSKQSKNFNETGNMLIEWDNLEVLKLLQNNYSNKIKCIYIDPPYNKDKDFVYRDTWKDSMWNYMRITWQVDEEWDITTEKEQWGRKHSNWLSMMYPRLYLARKLLRDDGVIFVSIDDDEVHNLRKLMDEIFGEDNFIWQFIWKSKSWWANDSRFLAVDHEYILCYWKNVDQIMFHLDVFATVTTSYNLQDEKWKYWLDRLDKQSLWYLASLDFPIIWPDWKEYKVEHRNTDHKKARRRRSQESVKNRYNELVFKDWYIYTKNYEKDWSIARSLLIEDRFGRTRTWKTDFTDLFDVAYFSAPKPINLLMYFMRISTNYNDLILDFFAWSWTTWHAVMDLNAEDGWNRKYILVQLPEIIKESEEAYKAWYHKISQITRDRLIKAWEKINTWDTGFKYFKLTSSNFHELDSIEVKAWETTSENLLSRLDLELEQSWIKEDRNGTDVLYELLIRYGYSLHSQIVTDIILPSRFHITDVVQSKELLVNLQNAISDDDVKQLIKTYGNNKTITIVCKDEALSDANKTTISHYFTNFISL